MRSLQSRIESFETAASLRHQLINNLLIDSESSSSRTSVLTNKRKRLSSVQKSLESNV
jgi:hypothetical protein